MHFIKMSYMFLRTCVCYRNIVELKYHYYNFSSSLKTTLPDVCQKCEIKVSVNPLFQLEILKYEIKIVLRQRRCELSPWLQPTATLDFTPVFSYSDKMA